MTGGKKKISTKEEKKLRHLSSVKMTSGRFQVSSETKQQQQQQQQQQQFSNNNQTTNFYDDEEKMLFANLFSWSTLIATIYFRCKLSL